MDIGISRWILEFILGQPLEDNILNTLIGVLPLPNDDVRLKIALLLRKIESEISNGTVSEKILEFLEVIEELYTQEGIEASEALKAAYCAVAVDCTVKFLNNKGEESEKLKYFEAVKRIWKQRINKMEKVERVGVVSGELWKWRDEIEAALWEDRCCDNVIKRSKSIAAIDAVKVFVKESKERIGPSFLEVMADTLGHDDSVKACLGLENNEMCGEEQELTCNNHDRETNKGNVLSRRKHVGVEHTRGTSAGLCRGVKNVDPAELGVEASREQEDLLPARKIVGAQEALKSSTFELRALPEALELAETLISFDRDSAQQPTENEDGRAPHIVVINGRAQQPTENGNGSAPHITVNNNGVIRANVGNADDQCSCHHNDASKPSLMARNNTAHTFEWDDSVDNLSKGPSTSGRRLTLPIPRRPVVSPLKKHVFNIVSTRRKTRKWSVLEEDTLRAGVEKYGVGNWRFIFDTYRSIFGDRTPGDLRVKWRNLAS